MTLIAVAERMPDLTVSVDGGTSTGPELTDDLLLYWEEIHQYGIGYYDACTEDWHFWVGERSVVADAPPSHWSPLPAMPE